MADDTRDVKTISSDFADGGVKLEEETSVQSGLTPPFSNGRYTHTPGTRSGSPDSGLQRPSSKPRSTSQTPKSEWSAGDDTNLEDVDPLEEPGKAAKMSRKSTQKLPSRPVILYDHEPDVTEEATVNIQLIKECIYAGKHLGRPDMPDLGDCECVEDWRDGKNYACGEWCQNRDMKIECTGSDRKCGEDCQNQQFQRRQYADVTVFKTEKKGYGLRANTDLNAEDFIFEYVGEVINEPTQKRRAIQYSEEGLKHFYFMTLTRTDIVDATKKGNLARFCNHSCNPNCHVDKWVVGSKLRMGIFAKRNIKAGEELVFDYNADRYGAEPEPCYCGEPNCPGILGGKTQTGSGVDLPYATIEALGIDDSDAWDAGVAKKPRKKKAGESDEAYVTSLQPRPLDEVDVHNVMSVLVTCKEKWIVVKILTRIQRCDEDKVRNRVAHLHGYEVMRNMLTTYQDDTNVVLQILDILYKLPRLTRNKISDSKIEEVVEELRSHEHEDVAFESSRLIDEWSKLQVAYRIPRRKEGPVAAPVYERRNAEIPRMIEKPIVRPIVAPTGPRAAGPSRPNFMPSRLPPSRRPFNALPTGWFVATDANGTPYYYSKTGHTQWSRPVAPAPEPPPPPKEPLQSVQQAKMLQGIIDDMLKETGSSTPSQSAAQSANNTPTTQQKKPEDKWKLLPLEQQHKQYEKTLAPLVMSIAGRYKNQLPKDDLKRFGKEITKKIVASDFKRGRVENINKLNEDRLKEVKKFVKTYFEKAVAKKKEKERKLEEKKKLKVANGSSSQLEGPNPAYPIIPEEVDIGVSDDEDKEIDQPSPMSFDAGDSPGAKRKRESHDGMTSDSDSKRLKGEENVSPIDPTPPPPPPPPAGAPSEQELQDDGIMNVAATPEETQEARELREQEEALIRENEEAMAMDLDGSLKAEEEESKLRNSAVLGKAGNFRNINGQDASESLVVRPAGVAENMRSDEKTEIKSEQNGIISH
ncbi:hypothetical protein B0O99DRAFT_500407 [Bisporella sp. PMI_857]|nr:hypothetical protein B0O99DRAFT_500407 [Bisporella sp. PMI_857]